MLAPHVPLTREQWRELEFGRLGLDERQAYALAWSNVDLHAFAKLVAAGCPPELAEKILS